MLVNRGFVEREMEGRSRWARMRRSTSTSTGWSRWVERTRVRPPSAGTSFGRGAKGQAEDPGVDEGQQLLGPEGGRAGHQAGEPAVHVDLEVDVGAEVEALELDGQAQGVAQRPQGLQGRLDRARPPGHQRLGHVGVHGLA